MRPARSFSPTPIILSHSGPDGAYEHARNVPDEILLELAAGGGVIHINAFGAYLEDLQPTPERKAALDELSTEFGDDPRKLSEE